MIALASQGSRQMSTSRRKPRPKQAGLQAVKRALEEWAKARPELARMVPAGVWHAVRLPRPTGAAGRKHTARTPQELQVHVHRLSLAVASMRNSRAGFTQDEAKAGLAASAALSDAPLRQQARIMHETTRDLVQAVVGDRWPSGDKPKAIELAAGDVVHELPVLAGVRIGLDWAARPIHVLVDPKQIARARRFLEVVGSLP